MLLSLLRASLSFPFHEDLVRIINSFPLRMPNSPWLLLPCSCNNLFFCPAFVLCSGNESHFDHVALRLCVSSAMRRIVSEGGGVCRAGSYR